VAEVAEAAAVVPAASPLAWSEVGSDDGLSEDSLVMMMEWRKREYFAAADAGVAGMPARLARANPLERARAALLGLRRSLGLVGAILVTAVVSAVIAASISVAVTVHLLAPQQADAGAIADRNGPLDTTPSAEPEDGGVAVVVASATVGLGMAVDAGSRETDARWAGDARPLRPVRTPSARDASGSVARAAADAGLVDAGMGRTLDPRVVAELRRLREWLGKLEPRDKGAFLAATGDLLGNQTCPAYSDAVRTATGEAAPLERLTLVLDIVQACMRGR
jgi:hypothetical protein